MPQCRICQTSVEKFMTFGPMPIANGFLKPDQLDGEYFFELAPAFCPHCGMFQLVEQPAPEMMFHENYAYFASTSRHMQLHFQHHAEQLLDGILKGRADPFVVELGSNDGIMLRNFAARGIRHLGIEPSENVAAAAREQGVDTLCVFFGRDSAQRILAERGAADVILAANVMCHIPDLPSVADGFRTLLKPDGIVKFEDPYLGDMIATTSYDQIYDEHVFIFSATSVKNAFERHGLALVDVEHLPSHGGSMRYTLAHAGARPVSAAVGEWLALEAAQGLDKPETFDRFHQACEQSRRGLKTLLEGLKAEGKRVVGYGATSKSTTVLNYAGIGPDLVEFISDTTPTKQGKVTPGMHILVKPYADFAARHPDYALLFAWNHKAEIMEKEGAFGAGGGKWITYVPDVKVS